MGGAFPRWWLMRYTLLSLFVIALALSACSMGGRCVDDGVCSMDEQLTGTCSDCKPDFVVSRAEMNFHSDGGQIKDMLRDGETRTYTLAGVDYEITLLALGIQGANAHQVALFSVNGEVPQTMRVGSTAALSGGNILRFDKTGYYYGGNVPDVPREQSGIVRFTMDKVEDPDAPITSSNIADTLRVGETKTYTMDGIDYEVTLLFVSNAAGSTAPEAKFSVNGEISVGLMDNEVDMLSDGLRISVEDVIVTYADPNMQAWFTVQAPQGQDVGGMVYGSYCVQNLGGSSGGAVDVRREIFLGGEMVPYVDSVDFGQQQVVLNGNLRVVRTGDRIVADFQESPQYDRPEACFYFEEQVSSASMYSMNLFVDPDSMLAERSEDNNQYGASVQAVMYSYPEHLIEHNVGPYDYEYSQQAEDTQWFSSGGKFYGASYVDATYNLGCSVAVIVPSVAAEGSIDNFGGDIEQTPYGPVKVTISEPWAGTTTQLRTVNLAFLGRDGTIYMVNLLRPADRWFGAMEDPLVLAYLKQFGQAPTAPQPECLLNRGFECESVAVTNGTVNLTVRVPMEGVTAGPAVMSLACSDGLYVGDWVQSGLATPFLYNEVERTVEFQMGGGATASTVLDSNGQGTLKLDGKNYPVSVNLVERTLTIRSDLSVMTYALVPYTPTMTVKLTPGGVIGGQFDCIQPDLDCDARTGVYACELEADLYISYFDDEQMPERMRGRITVPLPVQ
jgi:hypothetical protein